MERIMNEENGLDCNVEGYAVGPVNRDEVVEVLGEMKN